MFSYFFYLHATLTVMCTKRCCSHVNELRQSEFLKLHLRLKLEKDPDICNTEMVGRIKTRQQRLSHPDEDHYVPVR